ncbi:hypothetical protein HSR122_2878 [Halapricum desulfuricans]|uniref:Uncharacterized protein n=1 Tax=Halapricum desulfuricans TaxID=2841257 RepID=A0A897NCP5_9EURY|nr:hypothetical protein HSR122_2878 [Halapricum desulfuricans]
MNYPTLLALTCSLRVGLPASTTRFAGTTAVPVGSAVSTGDDESLRDSFAHRKSSVSSTADRAGSQADGTVRVLGNRRFPGC